MHSSDSNFFGWQMQTLLCLCCDRTKEVRKGSLFNLEKCLSYFFKCFVQEVGTLSYQLTFTDDLRKFKENFQGFRKTFKGNFQGFISRKTL